MEWTILDLVRCFNWYTSSCNQKSNTSLMILILYTRRAKVQIATVHYWLTKSDQGYDYHFLIKTAILPFCFNTIAMKHSFVDNFDCSTMQKRAYLGFYIRRQNPQSNLLLVKIILLIGNWGLSYFISACSDS